MALTAYFMRRILYTQPIRFGKRNNRGAMRLICRSVRLTSSIVLVGLALLVAAAPASAQPVDVPATWGGDVSSRPRLTGDWGGLRDELGKKGVVFDVDLLVTPMDVLSGGRSTGSNTWGNADYTLNVDTDKLGLWPGGFFKVSADTGFGTMIRRNRHAGNREPIRRRRPWLLHT